MVYFVIKSKSFVPLPDEATKSGEARRRRKEKKKYTKQLNSLKEEADDSGKEKKKKKLKSKCSQEVIGAVYFVVEE